MPCWPKPKENSSASSTSCSSPTTTTSGGTGRHRGSTSRTEAGDPPKPLLKQGHHGAKARDEAAAPPAHPASSPTHDAALVGAADAPSLPEAYAGLGDVDTLFPGSHLGIGRDVEDADALDPRPLFDEGAQRLSDAQDAAWAPRHPARVRTQTVKHLSSRTQSLLRGDVS